ncbi:hypothetical protein C9374_004019 [Naegleria lovaniensis]|uniref:Uncharacterized protein n=1 Tax=Naegleria lovaniensis TaxID=51637 RepID=A0AA88KYQ8_NAELO|nr:uncharacterized protein C9374_004019 [Naegleria lovaniensis]KAG2394255.1 hypothetical protein C9374_004019 [Naegleria lovaniensis]
MSSSQASLDSNVVHQPFLNLIVHGQASSKPPQHPVHTTASRVIGSSSSAHSSMSINTTTATSTQNDDEEEVADASSQKLQKTANTNHSNDIQQPFYNPNFDHIDIATYYNSSSSNHHDALVGNDFSHAYSINKMNHFNHEEQGHDPHEDTHHVDPHQNHHAPIKVPTRISRRNLVIGFFVFIILHTLVMLLALGLFLGLYVGGESSNSGGNTNVIGNSTMHEIISVTNWRAV